MAGDEIRHETLLLELHAGLGGANAVSHGRFEPFRIDPAIILGRVGRLVDADSVVGDLGNLLALGEKDDFVIAAGGKTGQDFTVLTWVILMQKKNIHGVRRGWR